MSKRIKRFFWERERERGDKVGREKGKKKKKYLQHEAKEGVFSHFFVFPCIQSSYPHNIQ